MQIRNIKEGTVVECAPIARLWRTMLPLLRSLLEVEELLNRSKAEYRRCHKARECLKEPGWVGVHVFSQ